ncbi:hypothetical protein D9M71_525120 [compost metagenome]
MVAVSTEVIKATTFFAFGKGSVILMLGVAVLFIYWLVLDGIHSSAYERNLHKIFSARGVVPTFKVHGLFPYVGL